MSDNVNYPSVSSAELISLGRPAGCSVIEVATDSQPRNFQKLGDSASEPVTFEIRGAAGLATPPSTPPHRNAPISSSPPAPRASRFLHFDDLKSKDVFDSPTPLPRHSRNLLTAQDKWLFDQDSSEDEEDEVVAMVLPFKGRILFQRGSAFVGMKESKGGEKDLDFFV